jgi:hypothetical protein
LPRSRVIPKNPKKYRTESKLFILMPQSVSYSLEGIVLDGCVGEMSYLSPRNKTGAANAREDESVTYILYG